MTRSHPLLLRPAIALLRRLPVAVQIALVGVSALLALVAARWGDTALALAGAAQFGWLLLSFGVGIRGALVVLLGHLKAVSNGDLTQDIPLAGRDELAAVEREVQRMSEQLSQVVARIRSEAQLVAMSGSEATRHAQSLSERTESQAANLEQTRASLGTLLETVHGNAEQVRAADARAAQVNVDADAGRASVQASVESMRRIEQRSKQMGEIISAIDDIAFQTNLLALNASVEAARAGEAGRGFAVVAVEVRRLAQSAAKASAEIKGLIQASNAEVAEGVQTIEGSRASLAQAVEGIRDVAERLREVARSSDGQSAGLQEITHAVASLEEITQRNAQMAEGSVQTADLLRTRAASLSDGVKLMHLRQGCADEAKELAKRAAELVDRAGPDEAIRQFHDPEGAFRDRDLYIAVADREGYLRAFGPDPSKAGKLRVDAFPQVDQKSIAAASWRVIETSGGGWVEFLAPHPVTKRMVPKISYVAPALGGRWAVQCSVNRGDGLVGAAAA